MKVQAITLTSLFLAGSLAQAQTATQTQPLDLQLPTDAVPAAGGADSPGAYYGDVGGSDGAEKDADADKSVAVHGAFTTGIGYSSGYGTSTMSAAELDVSKRTDDGKTFDLHIDVSRTRGLGGPSGWNYDGPRYRGY